MEEDKKNTYKVWVFPVEGDPEEIEMDYKTPDWLVKYDEENDGWSRIGNVRFLRGKSTIVENETEICKDCDEYENCTTNDWMKKCHELLMSEVKIKRKITEEWKHLINRIGILLKKNKNKEWVYIFPKNHKVFIHNDKWINKQRLEEL